MAAEIKYIENSRQRRRREEERGKEKKAESGKPQGLSGGLKKVPGKRSADTDRWKRGR